MVYAAWMHQAAEGRFFFDNRFTTDPQPGLTIHLYFWALGLLSKLVSIPVAVTLARAAFTGLLVVLLGRVINRLELGVGTAKLALCLACLGGGIGFLSWQTFGVSLEKGTPDPTFGLGLSRLPADVWQPEIFTFSSMLTNSLFVVSLCLMLVFVLSVLDAETSRRPVLAGGLAFGLLMNIHSYDVLLLTLVCVAFAISQLVSKRFTWAWALRVLVMGLFALPAAAWFLYVLQNDPVFRARAATPTFSPNFRTLFFGLLPGLVCLAVELYGRSRPTRARVGAGLFAVGIAVLFFTASSHLKDEFWMGPLAFVAALIGAIGIVGLVAGSNPTWNFLASWAVVGIVAPYFPALFQRKLAAGLAIPVCILAAVGIFEIVQRAERQKRNLLSAAVVVVFAASSIRWFFRDLSLLGTNMSNTTMHTPLLSPDAARIVERLGTESGVPTVAAPPGILVREPDGQPILLLGDLNPVLSGLAGVRTYAGHWSETPSYLTRRRELERAFRISHPDEAVAFFRDRGISWIVMPLPEAFPGVFSQNPTSYGEVVFRGNQLALVKVR
jgi:arabinosyltransferase C